MTTKTATLEIPASEAAEVLSVIKELIGRMDRTRRQMKRDQVVIDRLKAETRAKLANLKAMR